LLNTRKNLAALVLLALLSVSAGTASAGTASTGTASTGNITHAIHIDDPLSQAGAYYSRITSHVGAALDRWGAYFVNSAAWSVVVNITSSLSGAAAHSMTSGYVRDDGSMPVYEQGAAYELRTGIDPNGADPDIAIFLNLDYLQNELWFDPDPWSRSASVDAGRTDAMSVMLHEIGHAIAFNGWGDAWTGTLPGNYASTWDALTQSQNGHLYFAGARAVAAYGAPVPITFGNNAHVGNGAGLGTDLLDDLMNGVAFFRGSRYDISALDLAMLSDMGVQVAENGGGTTAIPTPAPVALISAGMLALLGWRRRRPALRTGEATERLTVRVFSWLRLPRVPGSANRYPEAAPRPTKMR
jgi:hypothetical protein